MKGFTLLTCFIIFSVCCFSQNTGAITVIQEKTKHNIKLYAVNHTENTKQLLTQLNGSGFRRKTFKPIYSTIKAKDTILLTTLVKRSNVGLKLKYELYYDDRLELYKLQQSKKKL